MVYKAHLVRKKGLGEISISESVAVKILKGDNYYGYLRI